MFAATFADIPRMLSQLPAKALSSSRLLGRRPAPEVRLQCTPPSLVHAPSSPWQRLMFWLLAPAPQDAAPPLERLPAVRTEFMATLTDIVCDEAEDIRWRIHNARSLRELWHVRSDVFRLVAVQYGQAEAEQRLLLLNRHFPSRAPRTQFSTNYATL
jgi:hypothetical protein